MPLWPFRSRQPKSEQTASPLAHITDETPHRFRIWVASADADLASTTLGEPGPATDKLTGVREEQDGERGVSFVLESIFSPRTAAILRPLNRLHRAGVEVIGFEALDLVTEIEDEHLAALVSAWDEHGNTGPHRHRLEVLAGAQLLDRCLARLDGVEARGTYGRPAWRFATTCVAVNTPASEERMIRVALDASADDAPSLLGPAIDRAELARLTGSRLAMADEPLAALIRTRGYVRERAAYLASLLRGPLSEPVADALCEAALRGGESSETAIAALANAAPTDRVHDTLRRILDAGQPGPMAVALGSLAAHWPDEARPVWREFLASRSAPLRWAAEQTLGLHGTEEDMPDAIAHLAKLARTKSSTHMTPPRGAEIVALLLRHRDRADARAALDDLVSRWDRLGDDMRDWLERQHPELHPDRWGHGAQPRPMHAPAQPDESEEALTWPPPTLERDDDAWLVSFDEGAAHSPARERFEQLADAAPTIEILDGDREWLRLRIDGAHTDADAGAEAQAIIGRLWEEAGPG